jgi:lipopolysaccharide export system protein LptC
VRLSATRVFPLVLMLVLALLSFWLERAARETAPTAAPRAQDPDYYAEQFTVTDFSREGLPVTILSAARMVHYPGDDTTELVAPRLEQSKPEQPRLTLTAHRGTLSRDGAEAFLYDDVELVREAGAAPEVRMQTSFLHVMRDRSLVRTDREVTIREPGRMLVGRGMEYDNEARQLVLRAEVRGYFEANQ